MQRQTSNGYMPCPSIGEHEATPNQRIGLSPSEILTESPLRLAVAPALALAQIDIHLMDVSLLHYLPGTNEICCLVEVAESPKGI